jgi:hypothetical protein
MGWDYATGIGSVNASNLVQYWTSSDLSVQASGQVTAVGQLSYALIIGNSGPQSAAVAVSTVIPAGFTLVSGSGCAQSGQTVSCAVGTLGVGSTSSLTLVVEPSSAGQLVTLTFKATSPNADLDPGDGVATVSLNWPGSAEGSDAPLPPWVIVALGMCLIAAARRPLRRLAGTPPA